MKAVLALENGRIFVGKSVGATGQKCGEVVFNTAMTGYQEILTDTSYLGQLVMLTYPHIGNTGINSLDTESMKIQAAGLIVRDVPNSFSSWRGEISLTDYLVSQNIVAIAEIDTRELTHVLRENGSQNACISTSEIITDECKQKAINLAKSHPKMTGQKLAEKISISEKTIYNQETIWQLSSNSYPKKSGKYKVIAIDYGIKSNILRILAEKDCEILLVPANFSAQEILALNPDGILLSNGAGDPEPLTEQINTIKQLIDKNIPIFGICLGQQLLALAGGAKTVKMKFGHHGANHPVQDLSSKKVFITSQNHGFAVDENSLPNNIRATHRSLFDGSLQGIEWTDRPIFAFQGHPEASPGPHDSSVLFDRFINAMQQNGKK